MAGEAERVFEALRALEAIPDALDRSAECSKILRAWPEWHVFVADVRQQAMKTANEQGHTKRAIGVANEMSGERVGQIIAGRGRSSAAGDEGPSAGE